MTKPQESGLPDRPFFFRCINESCRSEFDIGRKLYQCPDCSDLLDIVKNHSNLDVEKFKKLFRQRRASNNPLDISGVQRRASNNPLDISGVWRYRELLPFLDSIFL